MRGRAGRIASVAQRVRSFASMTLVVSVMAGGFALAMVSAAGTGAIAIPALRISSLVNATRAIGDFISPPPDSATEMVAVHEQANGNAVTVRGVTEAQLEAAFARHTAVSRCPGSAARQGEAVTTLPAAALAKLTARAKADPAFAARITTLTERLCAGRSRAPRP